MVTALETKQDDGKTPQQPQWQWDSLTGLFRIQKRGSFPGTEYKAPPEFLQEYNALQRRIEALEAALREQASYGSAEDGTLCWCSRRFERDGETLRTEHDSWCEQARAALLSPLEAK